MPAAGSAIDSVEAPRFELGNRGLAIVAALMLMLGVGATAARTIVKYQPPGPFDPSRQGMCDFHNGIYFPTRAMLRGESPYGADYAATYPVARQIPFFSPAILALHAPLALMPLHVGEVLHFSLSLGVIVAIAYLVVLASGLPKRWDYVIGISAALVFTRGGHITLFDGYFTLELVLASLLAIHWGNKRPWLAALALVVVSAKPTYILPLGFLLLARGNFKPLVIGAILSVVAAAIPMGWMAYHQGDGDLGAGLASIRADISGAQEIHRAQEDESPVHSWTRVDLLAIVAKWTEDDPAEATHLIVMAVLLFPAMVVLFRRCRRGVDDGVCGLTGAIILSALLTSLYHQSYDVLLLVAPAVGVLAARLDGWRSLGAWHRIALAGVMLLPAYNYLSTRMFLLRIDPDPTTVKLLTSLNGISLAILMVWCLFLAARGAAKLPTESSQSYPEQQST